jgi:hypothetical protein
MRILTICPSIYPENLEKMLDTFHLRSSNMNDIIINTDRKSITKIINDTFEKYNDYDFYHITNDDVLYQTTLWDVKLAKKGKITYGTDCIEGALNGQFLMIDGDIARAVGWLQMPTLNRYCGDVCWRFIGQQLGILEHMEDVTITHNWNGADEKVNKEDIVEFSRWLPFAFKDIEKIRKVLL